MPGLLVGISEDPQKPDAEHRQREDAGEAAHERLRKADPLAVDSHQAELAHEILEDVRAEAEKDQGNVVAFPLNEESANT